MYRLMHANRSSLTIYKNNTKDYRARIFCYLSYSASFPLKIDTMPAAAEISQPHS